MEVSHSVTTQISCLVGHQTKSLSCHPSRQTQCAIIWMMFVLLQALVAAREADPTKWTESERSRMEKRATQLDMALAGARKKRQHAARLSRALMQLSLQHEGEQELQQWQASMASIASTVQSLYRYACGIMGRLLSDR